MFILGEGVHRELVQLQTFVCDGFTKFKFFLTKCCAWPKPFYFLEYLDAIVVKCNSDHLHWVFIEKYSYDTIEKIQLQQI